MNKVTDSAIRSMRAKGYAVDSICLYYDITTHRVRDALGTNHTDRAYAKIHTGSDLDKTGMFREISTRKWIK